MNSNYSNQNYYFYLIITVINVILTFNNKYNKIVSVLSAVFLFLSEKYFNKNIGEFWCLFVTIIPIIIFSIQKIDYIRKKYYN